MLVLSRAYYTVVKVCTFERRFANIICRVAAVKLQYEIENFLIMQLQLYFIYIVKVIFTGLVCAQHPVFAMKSQPSCTEQVHWAAVVVDNAVDVFWISFS